MPQCAHTYLFFFFHFFVHFCKSVVPFLRLDAGKSLTEPFWDSSVSCVWLMGCSLSPLLWKQIIYWCLDGFAFFASEPLLGHYGVLCLFFRLFFLSSHPDFPFSHAPCLTAFFSLARPFPTLALQSLPSIPRAQRPPCARCTQETLWSWTARCQRQLPSYGPKTARRLFRTTIRSLSVSSYTSATLHRPTRACTHARPLALRPLMRFASLLMSQVRRPKTENAHLRD